MKKVFVSLCMASVLMGLSSCASTKNAATLSSISGEWNIIEVNGTAVVPAPGQEFPYIGFDTTDGSLRSTDRLFHPADVRPLLVLHPEPS